MQSIIANDSLNPLVRALSEYYEYLVLDTSMSELKNSILRSAPASPPASSQTRTKEVKQECVEAPSILGTYISISKHSKYQLIQKGNG